MQFKQEHLRSEFFHLEATDPLDTLRFNALESRSAGWS